MDIAVMILSAGKGKRMGLAHNKLFHELDGIPILIHTLKRWKTVRDIGRFTLVVAGEEKELVGRLLADYGLDVDEIVVGGEERQDSVYHGLKAWKQHAEPDIALIHDGARPFFNVQDVYALLDKVKETKAAVLACPVKDTIKRVDGQGVILETLQRSELWAIQTPQGFSFPLLYQAYTHADEQGIQATDDASLVERLGVSVSVVKANESNIKLTTPEDLSYAEYVLRHMRQTKYME